MKEYKLWFEKAQRDFDSAKNSLNSDDYEWCCFQAQQAVEKGLKAMHIKKNKELLKSHDLVLLAKRLNAPREIVINCSQITPSYIDTRYPDLAKDYSEEDAKKILKLAKEVLIWIEKNL